MEPRIALYVAPALLILALLAGAFGFGGIAGSATQLSKVLFLLFLSLFLGSLMMSGRYVE